MKKCPAVKWLYTKKQLFCILFVFVLLITWPAYALGSQPITVIIDYTQLKSRLQPVLEQEQVFVPLRATLEALGAYVEWDHNNKTVTAISRGKSLQLVVNERKAVLNGDELRINVPVKTLQGNTFIPLRFVSVATGADVNWNATSRTVTINTGLVLNNQVKVPAKEKDWAISFVRHENNGTCRDLYMVTLDGRNILLVAEDVPLSYTWNPSGSKLAMNQDVLIHSQGTANPYGTWVKDMVNGRESLLSYPSGVMGPFVEATWLDNDRLMTSRGTVVPESRAIVVDTHSGEIVLELPPGFYPLGPRANGFVGVLRERENRSTAILCFWEDGEIIQKLVTENASGFLLDPSATKVAWLDNTNSKQLDDTPYNVKQVKIYYLDSGQLQTYPVWGQRLSWSPDGRYLTIPAGDTLQVLDVATGKIVQLHGFNCYPAGHFAWRPDTVEIVWEKVIHEENGQKRVELWCWKPGVENAPLFDNQYPITKEPTWSPDGRYLSYVTGNEEGAGLYLWDAYKNIHYPLAANKKGIFISDPRWVFKN